MTAASDISRRSVLGFLAGAPLLPLAGVSLSMLAGCATRGSGPVPTSVAFVGMGAPATADAQATTTVASAMEVAYSDGSRKALKLGYRPLFLTGDQVPDGKGGTTLAGGYYDIKGRPIMDRSGAAPTQFFSDCPDGYSLLSLDAAGVAGVKGNTVFAVVQFEYTSRDTKGDKMYGRLPSPIAVLTLDQDPGTGALRLVKYHTVDSAKAHGLWITCGASLSPWNTHLSSEEYEPDAPAVAGTGYEADKGTLKTVAEFKAFSKNLLGDETAANPYHYGHIPEVTVHADGTGTLVKHYCMGRISHELVQVMPDRRTVIMGDDATNGGLFMFVADRPEDLSAGTLYVARVTQQPGVALDRGGVFDLRWIELGHATSDEIRHLADTLKPDDIVEARTKDPRDATFTAIGYGGKTEWVRFKPGMEKAAAFLETHRWAPVVGGTLAFTKMEGVTLNARDKVAYMAMSYIYKSMSDGKSAIKVNEIKAGAVYQLSLKGGQGDIAGNAVASDWVPVRMATVPGLVGVDLATPDALGNKADPEHIANPDNLKYSERLRTLLIGEDSGNHVNNFLWAYNVDTGKLARILSCPAGAEFDRPAGGRRPQRLRLRHEQLPAPRRLGEGSPRQGQGHAPAADRRALSWASKRRRGLHRGHAGTGAGRPHGVTRRHVAGGGGARPRRFSSTRNTVTSTSSVPPMARKLFSRPISATTAPINGATTV